MTGGMVVPVSAQTTKIARVGILSGASLSTPANAHFCEGEARRCLHAGGRGNKLTHTSARHRSLLQLSPTPLN